MIRLIHGLKGHRRQSMEIQRRRTTDRRSEMLIFITKMFKMQKEQFDYQKKMQEQAQQQQQQQLQMAQQQAQQQGQQSPDQGPPEGGGGGGGGQQQGQPQAQEGQQEQEQPSDLARSADELAAMTKAEHQLNHDQKHLLGKQRRLSGNLMRQFERKRIESMDKIVDTAIAHHKDKI